MKLCIDWKAVCQDWKTSGLSKNRYFLSGRLEKIHSRRSRALLLHVPPPLTIA